MRVNSAKQRIFLMFTKQKPNLFLKLLPTNLFSGTLGALARTKFPAPLQRAVIRGYASWAGIEMSPHEKEMHKYSCLQDFFIRSKTGNIGEKMAATSVVSPADGLVISCGEIGENIISKGFNGNLASFFESREAAAHFDGGMHVSIHLRPSDYHRFHMPVQGSLGAIKHIPGSLLPVNKTGRHLFPSLYWKNERKILLIDTPRLGKVGFAAVGALGVGGITIHEKTRPLDKGSELGYFTMGSNIILFFEKGRVVLSPRLTKDAPLAVGQALSLT